MLQMSMKKKQEDARRHMESFVERFKAKASKARQAQSRMKALAKMEPIADISERARDAVPFSRAGEAARLADHPPRTCERRL